MEKRENEGGVRERERGRNEAWLALLISQNLSCFGLSSRSKLALKAEKIPVSVKCILTNLR